MQMIALQAESMQLYERLPFRPARRSFESMLLVFGQQIAEPIRGNVFVIEMRQLQEKPVAVLLVSQE